MATSKNQSGNGKRKAGTTAKLEESAGHARLKAAVKDILSFATLSVDVELNLNFTGDRNDKGKLINESSFDVVGFGASEEGKRFLIIFETKDRSDLKELNKVISAWEANIQKIKDGKATIISSEKRLIKTGDLEKFEDIRVCYAFGKKIDPLRFQQIERELNRRGLYAWSHNALVYFKKSAKTIGKAIRNELLKEFKVGFEFTNTLHEKAIRIKQGHLELFVLGAKPVDLLSIAYVSRRASQRPEAYQRILNKERMMKISEFVSAKNPLLPNSIIIAFDGDANIQSQIKYNDSDSKLSFPRVPCCAWIIDGQHRVYGFLNTKFNKASPPVFRLPVVAFKNLDVLIQNRAFVDINYNQKKIDPTLLCDLAASLPDFKHELTWPSRISIELNKAGPLKDKIKISELDAGSRISISSFARYGLLEGLLGYDLKKGTYNGPLFRYSPFKETKKVDDPINKTALADQVDVLNRYFKAVAANTMTTNPNTDPWRNTKDYSLLKPTGINALFLVLVRILDRYPRLEKDIHKDLTSYLRPLSTMRFTKSVVANQGGGWKGFRKLANLALRKLNKQHNDSLKVFGKKEKK